MGRRRIRSKITKREQAKLDTIERRKAKNEATLKEEIKPFTVTLVVDNISYGAKGDTIAEALEKIRPTMIRNKGIITATKDGMKSEIFLYPILMRRMLVNKMYRTILDRRLTSLLK